MKSATSTGVIAGVALALGAAVGVTFALRSAGDAPLESASDSMAPIPMLSARSGAVASWVDRGLLHLAEDELDHDLAQDAGLDAQGADLAERPRSLMEQRDELYRLLSYELGIPESQLMQIRAIVEASPMLSQGNPDVTLHPMSRQECRARRRKVRTVTDDQRICGSPNMVALFDPEHEDPAVAKLCIDQFEFPNIACEYPVVWVRAAEAARLCRILDKRLCDAHEWEGACAGKLRSAAREYESYIPRLNAELFHNQSRERVWATGYKPDGLTCATGAQKSPGCVDASWERCGTNSYPSGAFPRCVSAFGVYDQHGNVAEHMNLPLGEAQLGSRGGSGETEMKGSWFAFDEYHPHADDCRWRAPAWHATAVDSESSHFNYHLGFRCCRDLD